MWEIVNHKIDRIIEGFGVVAAFTLCAMMFMTTFESGARLLNRPTTWALELTEYANVYAAYFAASYAEKFGDHIRVDFFIDQLPINIKRYVEIFNSLCILFFVITLVYYGLRLSIESFTFNVKSVSPLGVPMFYVRSVLPLGMALMAVKCFLKLIDLIRNKTPQFDQKKVSGDI